MSEVINALHHTIRDRYCDLIILINPAYYEHYFKEDCPKHYDMEFLHAVSFYACGHMFKMFMAENMVLLRVSTATMPKLRDTDEVINEFFVDINHSDSIDKLLSIIDKFVGYS